MAPARARSVSNRKIPPKSQRQKSDVDKLFKSLEITTRKLASMTNSDEFSTWLDTYGDEDGETLKIIESNCTVIARKLRSRKFSSTDISALQTPLESRKFFVHRDGTRNFTLLTTANTFHTKGSIKYKTFGFVREKGRDEPLKFAISGSDSLIHDPLVLDKEKWSAQLCLEFGKRHGFVSQCGGYEQSYIRRCESGTDYATHAERKLMMFFAVNLLSQHMGKDTPTETLLANLPKLNRLYPQGSVTAEIFLIRDPCDNCSDFRKMMEDVTGLRFIVKFMETLGKCKLVKKGYNRGWAMDSDEQIFEFEDQGLGQEVNHSTYKNASQHGSRCQVVVVSKSVHKLKEVEISAQKGSKVPKTQHKSSPKEIAIIARATPRLRKNQDDPQQRKTDLIHETVTTISNTSKKIHKRSLEYKKLTTNFKSPFLESDNESDYEESFLKTPKSQKAAVNYFTPPNSSHKAQPIFDNNNPFGPQIQLDAERRKAEKRKERNISPSAYRHHHRRRLA